LLHNLNESYRLKGPGLESTKKGETLMNIHTKAIEERLALVLAVSRSMVSRLRVAQSAKDSEEISGLLVEAQTKAIQLKQDAEEIHSFVQSNRAWETHAAKLDEINEHINDLSALRTEMKNARATASPWQQQLISEVIPLLKELAVSITATIEHLNENNDRLLDPLYLDYAAANADYASDISQLILDEVAYGEAKHKAGDLARQIEVSH
jgi:antirestriction protein